MANQIARSLRRRLTPQEVRVWVRLRDLRPQELHFRRQVPLGPYIVDFACLRARLVVEIDGSQHGHAIVGAADIIRDEWLRSMGFEVFRFWNVDVDHSIESVIDTIFAIATQRQNALRRPSL